MITKIASLLHIKPGEGRIVALLFGLTLFPSMGGAIGSSGIEALFFSRFGVEFLPYMYMALGLVTSITTLILTGLLSRFSKKSLYVRLPVLLAFTLVTARVLVGLDLKWSYPVLWLGMHLLWTLKSLIGWGLAAMVCDTRQAKRLFPLFGAGGILGGALGGMMTQPLVAWMGSENLLLIWGISFLIAFFLIRNLTRNVPDVKRGDHVIRSDLVEEFQQGFRYIRRSRFLMWLSLAVIFFSVLYFSLAFPFSKTVANQFPDEDALAGFLGIFTGVATGVAFLASLFFANRIFARIGFMGAILVFPILYFAGFGVLLVTSISFVIIVFRFFQLTWLEGIASPAYQAVFNIVPPERREQTRAVISGVPGQAGIVLVGIMLAYGQEALQPETMFLIGTLSAVIGIYIVYQTRRAYSGALVEALRAGKPHIFYTEDEPFGGFRWDATALATVIEGISSPNPSTRRVSAEILAHFPIPEATTALIGGLEDPDPEVRLETVRSLRKSNAKSAVPQVSLYLNDPDPTVRLQVIETLMLLSESKEGLVPQLEPLLQDPDVGVRARAAIGILRAHTHPVAIQVLQEMAESEDPEPRIHALEAYGRLSDVGNFEIAEVSLDNPNPLVRIAAVRAMVGIDPIKSIDPLILTLKDPYPNVRTAVGTSLSEIGTAACGAIVDALADPVLELGAIETLERFPTPPPIKIRQYATKRQESAIYYTRLWLALKNSSETGERLDLLKDSLREIAQQHARLALRAVGLLKGDSAIAVAIQSLDSDDLEQRANALEMLDSIGEGELVRPILELLEAETQSVIRSIDNDAGDRDLNDWLDMILEDEIPWLRACAVFAAIERKDDQLLITLSRLAHTDPDPIVRITAQEAEDGGLIVETLPTLSLMERVLFLRRVPLFSNLPPVELKQIAGIATERLFPDGEKMVRQGEPGQEMYIIVSGEVRVVLERSKGKEEEIARRLSGEYVGEMAIISQEPRMASLVTSGEVRTLCIDQSRFQQILSERPETSLAVMRVLISRLKDG